ncbi:MAG: alpha-maltose-phosphate synthase [Frankiaceae bacterium]|nr:alpha-maltose-phosphate synthase [Frankiaceae bacterium]
MRVGLFTREYPPEVYGGAGVHVEYLAKELAQLVDLTVHCFGSDRGSPGGPRVVAHDAWSRLDGDDLHLAALRTMSVDLAMAADAKGLDVLHSHTWYANFAGHLGKLTYGVPHVVTTHSLEPLRPWKADQLGGGYALSSFCERTALEAADAIIAVSAGMREDVLTSYPSIAPDRVEVIYNGIDTGEYRPVRDDDLLDRLGIDRDRPYVLFVGRITRQKGLSYLLTAAADFDPDAQVVLCAGSPDNPQIGAEVAGQIEVLAKQRTGVVWIAEMLPRAELIVLLSGAAVFVCPSVYEPLGIVNLEAMACETAVVASAVGGIPEVVVDGETGLLVPLELGDDGITPADEAAFAAAIAERVNAVLRDAGLARRYGVAGRARAIASFSWSTIAAQTAELYRRVRGGTPGK